MKKLLAIFFCLTNLFVCAQFKINREKYKQYNIGLKYFTFNPFGLAEPQIAIGGGFGNRFTKRSEYFAELSFVSKTPFYNTDVSKLNGFRLIGQYRYHFLQRWKPLINLGEITRWSREKAARQHPFVAIEFRLKKYNFPGKNNFINNSITDTLYNYSYDARAISIGGALIGGNIFNFSNRWKLETTVGLGGKQKFVMFKNIPDGYELKKERRAGFSFPPIYEESANLYVQFAIRLRYMIGI
jgi:hypothetical protein